jgi:glutamine amidotransferase
MCQLFGFSYNGVNTDFSDKFMEFRSRGKHNPHAWGAALWTDTAHGPLVVRDPHPANTSRAAALIASLEARTLIAHVRYGTAKPLDSVVNAHPFVANVGGKDWAFAHNGFLRGVEEAAEFAINYAPVGTTDSEQFFSVLVDCLHNEKSRAAAVASAVRKYAGAGKLNFLLSNGEEFYFFSNHHGGLHYKATKNAVYVATVPLGDRTNWFLATPGTLYVVEHGKITAKVVIEDKATYIPKKKDVTDTTKGYVQRSLVFGNFERVRIRPDLTEEEWENLLGFIEERKGTAGLKRAPMLI